MIANLEASPLGRAVRRLDFQERERLEEEPPDDPDRHDIPATVAAGLESPPPAVSAPEKDSPAFELRRDMNSVTTQLAHMNELMQLILAQQQQRPQDATALASPSAGSPTDDQQQNIKAKYTGSPTDDQQ